MISPEVNCSKRTIVWLAERLTARWRVNLKLTFPLYLPIASILSPQNFVLRSFEDKIDQFFKRSLMAWHFCSLILATSCFWKRCLHCIDVSCFWKTIEWCSSRPFNAVFYLDVNTSKHSKKKIWSRISHSCGITTRLRLKRSRKLSSTSCLFDWNSVTDKRHNR